MCVEGRKGGSVIEAVILCTHLLLAQCAGIPVMADPGSHEAAFRPPNRVEFSRRWGVRCGGEKARGCYRPSRAISSLQHPGTMKHELLHHVLRDRRANGHERPIWDQCMNAVTDAKVLRCVRRGEYR
jgi:hypothetical protein